MAALGSSKDDEPFEYNEGHLLPYLARELAEPTSTRCFNFLTHELSTSKSLVMAATTAAIENPVYSIDTPKKTKKYGDIMFGLDEEFNESFKLTRTTVRSLVSDLKTMQEFREEEDSAIAKSICLLAYFLANSDITIEEVASVFSMRETDLIVDELVRVSKALQDVSGRVRLRWPLENESIEIGERFIRKFRFPDIMGVLGFWVFGDRQEGILVQAVVDDLNMYLDINATEISGGRPSPTEFYFRTATYSYISNFLPNEFNVLAMSTYPDNLPNVVTQYTHSNLNVRELEFNALVTKCMVLLRDTMKLQIKRFPRLLSIDLPKSVSKHVILGSCVLHNASIFYHDLAPF